MKINHICISSMLSASFTSKLCKGTKKGKETKLEIRDLTPGPSQWKHQSRWEKRAQTGTLLSYFSQSIKAGLACPVTSAEQGYGKIKVTVGSLTPSITRQKLCPAAVPVTTRSLQAPLNPPGFMKQNYSRG